MLNRCLAFTFSCRGKEQVESFGDPIPHNDDKCNKHYQHGEDPEEKFIPSKLKNFSKKAHSIPFSLSEETALNVERIVTCTECHKRRLFCSRTKVKHRELGSFKRVLSDSPYFWRLVFEEITIDKNNPD